MQNVLINCCPRCQCDRIQLASNGPDICTTVHRRWPKAQTSPKSMRGLQEAKSKPKSRSVSLSTVWSVVLIASRNAACMLTPFKDSTNPNLILLHKRLPPWRLAIQRTRALLTNLMKLTCPCFQRRITPIWGLEMAFQAPTWVRFPLA